MSEKQLSFHLSWVFALLLPCASAQSDDLALNSKLVDTVAGKLLISLIVLSLITIAMAIVLCTLCRIYCFNVIEHSKETKMLFRDVEEGSTELLALKEERDVGKEAVGEGEGGEKPATGDDEGGVDSKDETVEAEGDDKEVTLSTFGQEKDKKENETKIEEPTAKGNASGNGKEIVDQKSDTKNKEGKEATKEKMSSDEAAKEGTESKQTVDAKKTVEAAEQAQGQTKGPTLQPIPVAPPIIFDLSPATVTKSEPSAVGTPANKSKEELDKEKSVTKEADKGAAEKKAESDIKDEKETKDPAKVAESEGTFGAAIMGFDDIEKALGLALKDLGGDI